MKTARSSTYATAGVDIEAGNRAVELMKEAVNSTYGKEVLAGIGSFGGLYDGADLKTMNGPVLVASTDGVGTKVKLASQVGRYESIGQDIVNHCINDILVQGARPLFFMDYFATSKLSPEIVAEIVLGMSQACRKANCVLLGGETAEMPGVYLKDEFDIAGTIVGVVERSQILPKPNLQAGDVLIGLTSSGPHTNGYSLIHQTLKDIPLETIVPELGVSLADALLTPHRSYYRLLYPLLKDIKGLAHITGGGFIENIPRILPKNLSAQINPQNWPVPPLFQLIAKRGQISPQEMYRVFNMGIGMVAIVEPKEVKKLQQAIPETTYIMGKLIPGQGKTILTV